MKFQLGQEVVVPVPVCQAQPWGWEVVKPKVEAARVGFVVHSNNTDGRYAVKVKSADKDESGRHHIVYAYADEMRPHVPVRGRPVFV